MLKKLFPDSWDRIAAKASMKIEVETDYKLKLAVKD